MFKPSLEMLEGRTMPSFVVTAPETAFAAAVPPPLIAANHATLAALVSTNILGQNTAVIAQLESEYGEMWAQDAKAMYDYASAQTGIALAATGNLAASGEPKPTTIYTIEYDGVADFPEYPLDILADLNALLGFYFISPTSIPT